MFQKFRIPKIPVFVLITFIFISDLSAQQPPSQQMQAANQLVKAKKWSEAAALLEDVTKNESNNPRAWFLLGNAYHQLGQYEKAVQAYQKNIPLSNNPSAMYNLACVYSRLKENDKAFEWLEKSFKTGVIANTNFKTDEDLANIRDDPRFKKIEETVDRITRPCMYSAEPRQFDFWIGDWDVYPFQVPLEQAPKVGSNRIEMISQGCALLENWGSANDDGKSINYYDSNSGKWYQYWIGSGGVALRYEGNYKDGVLTFEGVTVSKDGKKTFNRLTFTKIDDNTVRQFAEFSTDEGKTWKVSYDFRYVKKK